MWSAPPPLDQEAMDEDPPPPSRDGVRIILPPAEKDELMEFKRELYKAVRPRINCATLPCVLLDDLMMSDEKGVSDARRLRSMGVTHVLNLAKCDVAPRGAEYAEQGIVYLEIDAYDRPGYDVLGQHFEEAFGFYQAARQQPGAKVVVHCLGGVNRSGLVATAMYMWATNTTILEAAAAVNRARGSYLWNDSFRDQLITWAAEQDLLGVIPLTESPCISLPSKVYRRDAHFPAFSPHQFDEALSPRCLSPRDNFRWKSRG